LETTQTGVPVTWSATNSDARRAIRARRSRLRPSTSVDDPSLTTTARRMPGQRTRHSPGRGINLEFVTLDTRNAPIGASTVGRAGPEPPSSRSLLRWPGPPVPMSPRKVASDEGWDAQDPVLGSDLMSDTGEDYRGDYKQ